MKKLIVVGIIALMITGLSVAANAFAGTVLSLEPVFDGGSFQPVLMGWWTDNQGVASADNYDVTDGGTSLTALPGQIRFNLGSITGAPSDLGTPNADFKLANVANNGQTNAKRWVVTGSIETNPDHVGGTFGLSAAFNTGFAPVGTEFYIFAGSVSLANCKAYATAKTNFLVKMTSAVTSYASGSTKWTLAAPTSSSYYDEDNDVDVTVWGSNPTQSFTVYAQAAPLVPEPGSMLAMFSGLVGLVGFGIRRRK